MLFQRFYVNLYKGIYLFEIKRVRRITSFSGNELATVLIAVVYIALLVWETLTVQSMKNIQTERIIPKIILVRILSIHPYAVLVGSN